MIENAFQEKADLRSSKMQNAEPNIGIIVFGSVFGAKGSQKFLVPFRSLSFIQAWCFARNNGN
jgi:hypothetical protein